MINATRRILSTLAVICLVALTAMAEDPRTLEKQAAVPTAGLTLLLANQSRVYRVWFTLVPRLDLSWN